LPPGRRATQAEGASRSSGCSRFEAARKAHLSPVKSQEQNKGESAAPKGKPGRKPRVAQLDQEVTIQPTKGNGVVADLAAVKALVEKLGVDEVVEIAKLFG
jgi:hypothetical protein